MNTQQLAPDIELETLRNRLEEAEETLRAIRSGAVDALVVDGTDTPVIYTLRSAAEPYRLLVEQMHEGALTVTSAGVIVYCNPAFTQMARLAGEQLRGTLLSDLLTDKSTLADLLSPRGLFGREILLRTGTGEFRNAYVSSAPLAIEEEALHCVVVTDLSRQELRLRHDAIVNASADPIYSVTLNGMIETWNAAAERLYGYLAPEVVGQHWRMLILREQLSVVEAALASVPEHRKSPIETIHIAKSGRRLDVALSIAPIRAADGKVEAFAVIVRDITERKRNEQALRVSEERLLQAVRVANLGVFEHDHQTNQLTCSPQLRAMLGFGEVEPITPEAALARVLPDDQAELAKKIARAQDPAGDGLFASEHRVVRGHNEIRWLSVRSRTFFDEDGNARRPARSVGAVIDITERKEAEEHIHFLLRETSHRSKNLLSVIQAITAQTARSASTMSDFEGRLRQRLHGLAVSHDLLVTQDWKSVSLAVLVRQQFAPFADPDGRLILEGPELSVTPGAAENIGLALNELATNAIKYGALSVPTGNISVTWTLNGDGGERRLQLRWRERGGPPVTPPSNQGFGHVVIQNVVPQSLDGTVETDFAPDGFRWFLEIPSRYVVGEAAKS